MTTLAIRRFSSRAALDAALEERLARAITASGPRAIMLSGGTTPLPAYRALGSRALAHAEGLHIFFSDERYVPSDSQASNYLRSRPLLDALALRPEKLLRVRTELPLAQAAEDYERALGAMLGSGVHVSLGLLGLGADGHTASLFSAADLARARGQLAIAVQRPDGMSAVSVTPQLLAQVEELIFVVVAAGKREAIRALEAHDANLTAWRAVEGCPALELWLGLD